MSVSTNFRMLNANDPQFVAAQQTAEARAEWEDEHGSIENTPGARIDRAECDDGLVEETDEEYGGWIIDLSKVPKGTTHIKVERY